MGCRANSTYAVGRIQGGSEWQTETIRDCNCPNWTHNSFVVDCVPGVDRQLQFVVMDENRIVSNEALGSASMFIQVPPSWEPYEKKLPLSKSGRIQGHIHIRVMPIRGGAQSMIEAENVMQAMEVSQLHPRRPDVWTNLERGSLLARYADFGVKGLEVVTGGTTLVAAAADVSESLVSSEQEAAAGLDDIVL